MIRTLITALAVAGIARAEVSEVPDSLSPDTKNHAVMDIDRDPLISPEWKGDSFPQIEITQKDTGRVLASIAYFGSPGDDARPLREHVSVSWRPDSKAFAITINDRFYSSSVVFALDKKSKFVEVAFPSYQTMTGFPLPDAKHLRPRGRETVEGWDKEGRLIYGLFASPLPSLTGHDPLVHRVLLEVTADGMIPKGVESEKGEWRRGDWILSKAEGSTDKATILLDSKTGSKFHVEHCKSGIDYPKKGTESVDVKYKDHVFHVRIYHPKVVEGPHFSTPFFWRSDWGKKDSDTDFVSVRPHIGGLSWHSINGYFFAEKEADLRGFFLEDGFDNMDNGSSGLLFLHGKERSSAWRWAYIRPANEKKGRYEIADANDPTKPLPDSLLKRIFPILSHAEDEADAWPGP